MSEIVLWGATGQAKVLYEALKYTDVRVVAVLDHRNILPPIPNVPLLVGEEAVRNLLSRYSDVSKLLFAVAIGGPHGADRLERFLWLRMLGLTPLTIVHPTAFRAEGSAVGEACQILAMSSLCANARLGRAVILNTAASVDHDCEIGDGVHIAPGARLAGEITIGARTFIGTGAVILPGLHIGEDVIVGAGAVVTKNVPPRVTVVGNPAHPVSPIGKRHE